MIKPTFPAIASMTHKSSPHSGVQKFHTRRRRGVTYVYMCLGMAAMMGGAAISIDYGVLQIKRAQVQEAADAAALAGAWNLANFSGSPAADAAARNYANLNGGYVQGNTRGDKVKITYPASDEDGVVHNNWFRVDISRPEPTFFAAFFGKKSVVVGTTATALYETLADFDINGDGDYGIAPGPVNLSLFGPNGFYNNGDCYSVKKLPSGAANPLNTNWTGYDFAINVPKTSDWTNCLFEIFDPDCHNLNNGTEAGYPTAIDEYRNSSGGSSTAASDRTTTKYSLYYDNNTPANPNDDVLIDSKSWGDDSTTDMKWVRAFNFDRSSNAYKNGQFRLNVLSTAGASENGFDLRVGKSRTSTDNTFNQNNGTSIKATGHIPINFNTSGTSKIALGTIPIEAAGGTLSIRKFDTDVGSKSITYTCSSLPGKSWSGVLSNNGTFATDTIQVPNTYTTPGVWYATYQAGLQDTSVWDKSYSNSGPGKPGGIKLVR